jgi:hypothetical protein
VGSLCYVKLDIQIAYTNIGSIYNPQPVLSAVIFNYQGIVSKPLYQLLFLSPSLLFLFLQAFTNFSANSTLLVYESVTFQDISPTPGIIQGQIPTPNTRLPANFLYPFSGSQTTYSKTFSSFSFVFVIIVFILM